MRMRPLTAVLACATVVAASPVLAGAASAADDVPAPPAHSSASALAALGKVHDLLAGDSPAPAAGAAPDLTLALLDLRDHRDHLSSSDRRQADRLLARPSDSPPSPSDSSANSAWKFEERKAAKSTCNDTATYGDNPFCVHWVPAGTKVTVNGTQYLSKQVATDDAVQKTVDTMKTVWETEIATLGYSAPKGDGLVGGGVAKLDVYLANCGAAGVFGYAVPEQDSKASSGYLVLDNDFSLNEFPGSTPPDQLRQVTTAHEFFHLVQFGYDSWDSAWLMESTATWMEEQVYDAINDNRAYIAAGSERWPGQSLDLFDPSGGAQYGTWVFHQLLSEHLGADVVRHAWEYAAQGAAGDNARWALNTALTDAGSSLAREFRTFSAGGLAPSRFWSEGSAFPYAALTKAWSLGSTSRSIPSGSVRLDHLAGADFKFTPKAGLDSSWKLGIRVDAPNTGGTAYAVVFWTDGHVTRVPIDLDSTGAARRTLPFSSAEIRAVGLALANSGTGDGMTIGLSASIFH